MNFLELKINSTISDHHHQDIHIRTMSGGARNPSFKLQGLVTFFCRYKISPAATGGAYPGRLSQPAARVYGQDYSLGYGGYVNSRLRTFSTANTNIVLRKGEDKIAHPTLPVPGKQGFFGWAKWLLGSFLTLFIPFLKLKWDRLRALEDNVEKVVEEAEVMAEMVEEAATTVEKVSSEVAGKFPDNAKIKQAALILENISTVAAQEAKLTEDFIHKVGEVKQDLEEMKTIAEPVIDEIVKPHQSQNSPSSDNK